MRLGITKEYHHEKLALESRKVCHTLVYLVTLLHSSDTKDVKEVMTYIQWWDLNFFSAGSITEVIYYQPVLFQLMIQV